MNDKFETIIGYIQLILFLFVLCLAFVAYFIINVAIWCLKSVYELVLRWFERVK